MDVMDGKRGLARMLGSSGLQDGLFYRIVGWTSLQDSGMDYVYRIVGWTSLQDGGMD